MARTLHGALGHRVHAARVCDVLLFALYPVCTAVSAGPVPGLPCVPLCLAAGLLCVVSSLLPDPSQRTAFLSCRLPHPPLYLPVAHHASPSPPALTVRYSRR